MNPETIILVIAIAVVAIAIVFIYTRKRRTAGLRQQFGPEYERTVQETGRRDKAESELEARRQRVEQSNIKSLAAADQEHFAERWRQSQAHFVDEPAGAIQEADQLIREVMQARGYPVGDFEQRAADISVDHPDVVTHYRDAHRIAELNDKGTATTEDLRNAMIHYRALFEDMLETRIASNTDQREESHARAS